MIQREAHAIDVESTMKGDVIDLSIDQAAMAHIMTVLTDLYSDPELAVLREYSTNALDAHIEAGNPDPIRVYTPTPLSPFFRVKDEGIGLSPQDIQDIYSKYGASTKRGTNDQVGMLGLGCKSALTYASQFTLTGVKDGVRCQVSISRSANGAGAMTVVDTATTDAPNGVEITVPVRGNNEFEAKAKRFFSFWRPGTVLLNDKEPARVDGLKLSDDLYVVEHDRNRYSSQPDTIVMGNVPYPVKERLADNLAYTHSIVAYVPIGDVDFTPSREELQYTDATNQTVQSVKQNFATLAQGAIQRFVDDAPTHAEALATVSQWSRVMPNIARQNTYTYKGQDIPTVWKSDRMFVVPLRSHVESRHVLAHHGHPAEVWHKTTWVYGYDVDKKWSAPKGRKLRKYAGDHGIDTEHFAVLKDKPVSDWIDPATCVPWEDIAAIKLDRTPSQRTGRIPGSYPAYVDGDYERSLLASDIDTSKPLYYAAGGRYAGGEYVEFLNEKHPKGYTLVQVTSNRAAKFKRDFPNAKTPGDVIRKQYDAWTQKLSKEQREALIVFDAGRYWYSGQENDGGPAWRVLRKLDAAKVDDPEVHAAIKLAQVDLRHTLKRRRLFSDLGYGSAQNKTTWKNPLDKYPLLNMSNPEHSYIYINAVYAAQKKGA